MNNQTFPNRWYGFEKETTEGTAPKADFPFQSGAIFPTQNEEPEEHQHTFCFAMNDRKVLRGCQSCGKAWIALLDTATYDVIWTEIRERKL